jgi:transposase
VEKYKDRNWLEDQYVNKEMSIDALAEMCKVHKQTIIDALNDFKIYRYYKKDNWLNR